MQRGNISIFATFGGHLGFYRKRKSVNISKTVRDRVIWSEYLNPQGSSRVSYAKGKNFHREFRESREVAHLVKLSPTDMLASYSVALRPNVCCNFVSLGTQCISLAEEFQQLIYHE